MTNYELLKLAKDAMQNSYSPYSNFKVGAAILTEDNKLFTGTNIENSSFGATICAERVAAVKAISEGSNKFKKLAVVSSAETITYPCGICRQFFSEFIDDCLVILEDKKEGIKEIPFKELFPYGFSLEVKNGG